MWAAFNKDDNRNIIHWLPVMMLDLRSGGPSLRQSAEYPQGFAEFVADRYMEDYASWNIERTTDPVVDNFSGN